MNAGRELDAMVAEKVMGLTVRRADAPLSLVADYLIPGRGTSGYPNKLPAYSTDIAAAWEVVERMTERGWHTVALRGGRTEWTALFESIMGAHKDGLAQGETPALAICLAALKCAGVEVPA